MGWPLELWGPGSSSQISSYPKQTLFEQCTNVFSCARILLRESLGVSRVNHVLRVLWRSCERLFPGFTEDSSERHAAQANPGQDATARGTLRVQHTLEHSLQRAVMQDAVTAGLLPKQPFETSLAAVIDTASTYLEASMTKTELRPSYTFRKRPRRQTMHGNEQSRGTTGQPSRTQLSEIEHSRSLLPDDDEDDLDFSPGPRKSRLSAPQLQAQLSRLSDRTRPRRPKNTLLSKGAWQQVARIQDFCASRTSLTSCFITWMYAREVLSHP